MINADLPHNIGLVPFDAMCHYSPLGNFLQVVSITAHNALRAVLPMDAQGCHAWVNSPDPEVADAEAERIFGLVEGAGLTIRIL